MKRRPLTLNMMIVRPTEHFHLHVHLEEQDDRKVGKKPPRGGYAKAFLAGLKPSRGVEQ